MKKTNPRASQKTIPSNWEELLSIAIGAEINVRISMHQLVILAKGEVLGFEMTKTHVIFHRKWIAIRSILPRTIHHQWKMSDETPPLIVSKDIQIVKFHGEIHTHFGLEISKTSNASLVPVGKQRIYDWNRILGYREYLEKNHKTA
ncbi:MAG: hypothetical protein WCO16_03145 [bacterium]